MADPLASRVFIPELEPDGIGRQPIPCDTPERRLAAAVLQDGIRAAQGRVEASERRASRRQERYADAWAWLRLSRDVPFSAAFLCDHLGLDYEYLIARVRDDRGINERLRRHGFSGAKPAAQRVERVA